MNDLQALLDQVLERAETGEGLEVFGLDETETTVSAREAAVESLTSARTRGVGMRVVNDGRVGYASTADLSETALGETLEQARTNARVTSPDEANVLAEPAEPEPLPGLYEPDAETVAAEFKVDLALELEAAAASAAPPIRGVDVARYGDALTTAAIASTTGVRAAYRRSDAYVLVEVLAERDDATMSAYGLAMARRPHALDVRAAADEAVQRATRIVGGSKPDSAKMVVIFDPFVTASFLGVLASALTAEAVQRGRSLFAEKVGERLGPEHLTLIDDGRHPDGPASAPWDGEGVPTGRTRLLDAGVLRGFLHNTYTANRGDTTSTGNASRAGYKGPPGLSPTNLYLEPGSRSQSELLREVGTAFYCQQVMGLHSGANPVTGDFSVGAAGAMVRDGAFAEPVREVTVAGTIPTILEGITAVGADLRFLPFGGGMGGLTLVVEGMTLAGA